MQVKIEELTSQLTAAALDETRVQELTELQQELASKIEEMKSLSVRLAASLQAGPPAPES